MWLSLLLLLWLLFNAKLHRSNVCRQYTHMQETMILHVGVMTNGDVMLSKSKTLVSSIYTIQYFLLAFNASSDCFWTFVLFSHSDWVHFGFLAFVLTFFHTKREKTIDLFVCNWTVMVDEAFPPNFQRAKWNWNKTKRNKKVPVSKFVSKFIWLNLQKSWFMSKGVCVCFFSNKTYSIRLAESAHFKTFYIMEDRNTHIHFQNVRRMNRDSNCDGQVRIDVPFC